MCVPLFKRKENYKLVGGSSNLIDDRICAHGCRVADCCSRSCEMPLPDMAQLFYWHLGPLYHYNTRQSEAPDTVSEVQGIEFHLSILQVQFRVIVIVTCSAKL